ncbi:hypothetical protein BBJ29_002156 [Phytophthora kernoviae]|uniref:Anoctamin transmembrane domain-containing protein n=1 Tax=Phytophthora kernoviae TaxID=325452 RepID=A0A3R7KLF2_9STRA|nr:hypothetical protein BBJ29_002156 [Phytophthora kernoviae]
MFREGYLHHVVDYRMKYEFALILHNKPTTPRILARNGLDAVGKRQMEVLSRCIKAGFEVSIGAVGEVPSEIEQLIASSNIGDVESPTQREDIYEDAKDISLDDDQKFTPAERIQTIARIITSTSNVEELNPPGANISFDDENRNDAIIMACFPLHNRYVDSMLLSKCGQWWWKSKEITNELRYYYGERVAFYFSFLFVYTKCLLVPAVVGCAVYALCSKCPDCVAFLSCFNTQRPILLTGRWCYIFAQGILLGISLDIFVYLLSVKLIRFFVTRENQVDEAHFQRTMINRLFAINWISFFLWFMLIAFAIVPFGDEVETWLSENLKYTKLTVRWENGVIDMSTAFVTPLLITQALNLLVDTSLPIIFRRESLRASKLAKKIMKANPSETLLALSEYHSSFENLSGQLSHSPSSGQLAFKDKIELQMMTPIRIPYIEEALEVSIPTLEGFENEKYFMTADDVLEESQLPLYNAFPDYLRMVIQYVRGLTHIPAARCQC